MCQCSPKYFAGPKIWGQGESEKTECPNKVHCNGIEWGACHWHIEWECPLSRMSAHCEDQLLICCHYLAAGDMLSLFLRGPDPISGLIV